MLKNWIGLGPTWCGQRNVCKGKLEVGFEVFIYCDKDGGLYPEASRWIAAGLKQE